MIELSLNNEAVHLNEEKNLADALREWGYGEQKIAIAINGDFIPRSRYLECKLRAGDQVDIVKPIGGG